MTPQRHFTRFSRGAKHRTKTDVHFADAKCIRHRPKDDADGTNPRGFCQKLFGLPNNNQTI